MATGTIKTDMKVISRELVQEGYSKRFDIKYYWDSHGNLIWDFKEPEIRKFSEPKKYEVYKEVREYYFDFCPTQTWEFLFLYIDGEKVDLGEITFVQSLKTKVKIESCVGAG